MHKQTNKDCATINSDRSASSSVQHKQGEKQQRGRDASATRRNNLVNVGKKTNLITLLGLCVSSPLSPNTVTKLSHNSIGHGVVGVNIVVTTCSSQQHGNIKCFLNCGDLYLLGLDPFDVNFRSNVIFDSIPARNE